MRKPKSAVLGLLRAGRSNVLLPMSSVHYDVRDRIESGGGAYTLRVLATDLNNGERVFWHVGPDYVMRETAIPAECNAWAYDR